MKSIIQNQLDRRCYICGRGSDLEVHHCIHGTANRKLADKWGLTCYLCNTCHFRLHNQEVILDRFLQQTAQQAFENKVGTREQFMQVFGKNYL